MSEIDAHAANDKRRRQSCPDSALGYVTGESADYYEPRGLLRKLEIT